MSFPIFWDGPVVSRLLTFLEPGRAGAARLAAGGAAACGSCAQALRLPLGVSCGHEAPTPQGALARAHTFLSRVR